MTAKDEALSALAAHTARAAKLRAQLDRQEVEHVAACRDAGVSWLAIADTLGIKQPSAVRKYKPLLTVERRVRPKASREEAP